MGRYRVDSVYLKTAGLVFQVLSKLVSGAFKHWSEVRSVLKWPRWVPELWQQLVALPFDVGALIWLGSIPLSILRRLREIHIGPPFFLPPKARPTRETTAFREATDPYCSRRCRFDREAQKSDRNPQSPSFGEIRLKHGLQHESIFVTPSELTP